MKDIQIIKEALTLYAERERKAISDAIDNMPPLSDEFYKRLDQRIFDSRDRLSKMRTLKKRGVILIAAILTAFLCVACAVVEKTEIGEYFVEWFEDHLRFVSDEKLDETVFAKNVNISYIPENYENTLSDINNQWGTFEWKKGEDYIHMDIFPRSGSLILNTENNNYTVLNVGDYVVHRTEYPGEINAFWDGDKLSYYIKCTNLPWEEMVKIIEGITYEEQ